MINIIDVTLEKSGDSLVLVKLQSEAWELNIRASAADLGRLDNIRDANWVAHRSLRIGTCAGAPVHWCVSDDQVMILIGHDDETWEIAIAVPLATVEKIVSLA